MSCLLSRRVFGQMLASASVFLGGQMFLPSACLAQNISSSGLKRYKGPNIILIRYGGGVRRRETIDPSHSFSPYMMNVLAPSGTLFSNMTIAQFRGNETDHAQGTINLLTGRYKAYRAEKKETFADILQPTSPTLFEYFRKTYDIPVHESLIINGEDRLQDESMNFAQHRAYGINYRAEFLSYSKYKAYIIQRDLERDDLEDGKRDELINTLAELQIKNLTLPKPQDYPRPIQAFWEKWERFYKDDKRLQPRGDRLSTEIALWALRELQPKLMMVNYQDPDFVHFGIESHYTRGIAEIDRGIQLIMRSVETNPFYRENTVVAIVPDCGRDDNPLMSIPYQHHFSSRSSHEIFALFSGSGIAKNKIITKEVDQISVAATLAKLMNFEAPFTEGPVLEEVLI